MGVARQRAAARNRSCENNLKQLGLAFHNYHSAYKQLPIGAGGTDAGGVDEPLKGNAGRLSALVGVSPFMEEQRLWDMIFNQYANGSQRFPGMGPVPWFDEQQYKPWSMRPEKLVCPDDPETGKHWMASSYVLNYGDGVDRVFFGRSDWPSPNHTPSVMVTRATQRGVFGRQTVYKFRDILDGLSNTLMMSESKVGGLRVAKNVSGLPFDPSLAIKAQSDKEFWPVGREARWCDGLLRSTGFQTILPPGSPSATSDQGDQTAVMSASSFHGSGAHVLFGDGAVRYVTSSIDAGDSNAPSVGLSDPGSAKQLATPGSQSPYGLWGALGSRASGERVSFDDEQVARTITKPRRTMSAGELQAIRQQPMRTWTAAGGGGTMKGWLVSCSKSGDVVLASESGDLKYVTLSDLVGDDSYFIVQSIVAEKMKARDVLLEQLRDAVGLLERKEFDTFVKRYVDASQLTLDQMTMASSQVYLQRGMLIQGFDDAIRMADSGLVQIETEDSQTFAVIGGGRSPLSAVRAMRYSNGRWYWVPGRP